MIHLFSTRFELEHSELDLMKEQLSVGEAALSDQASKPVPTLAELDPISEDEEEGGEADDVADSDSASDSDAEVALEQVLPSTQSAVRVSQARAQNKRAHSEIETPNSRNSQLPRVSLSEEGRPERHRKQPKLPAGFEIDKTSC
jgi:hypothetical protein